MTLNPVYVTIEDQKSTVIVEESTTFVELATSIPWAQKFLYETDERASNYTLQLSDLGMVVPFNALAAVTVTIPLFSATAFPVGSVVTLYNASAQYLFIAASPGVLLRGYVQPVAQYRQATLRKRATDEWVLSSSN